MHYSKGFSKILAIILIILILTIVGTSIFFIIKNKTNGATEQNSAEQPLSEKKYLPSKTMTDEQAKTFFHATEIVLNNLPDSIDFWTEAYCPKSGTNFDYDSNALSNYIVDRCEQGEIGSHSGCKTCIMSKLILHEKLPNETQGFVYGTIAKIQKNDLNISLLKKENMLKQIFKETSCIVSGDSAILNYSGLEYNFNIDEVISSSFSAPQKNEKLFSLKRSGSNYRDNSIIFALFDENQNLLSTYEKDEYSCVLPDLNSHYMRTGYLYCDTTKISYIVGIEGGCTNGGVCGDGNPKLLQFKNGKFIEIQNVNTLLPKEEENPIYLYSMDKNSISVYRWNFNLKSNFECIKPLCMDEYEYKNWNEGKTAAPIFLKKLNFNNQTCQFE